MIDLLALPPTEAERIAYAEGFTMAAELFARIADLEANLEDAQWRIDLLQIELDKERSQ